MKKLFVLIFFYLVFTGCNIDKLDFFTPEENYYTITNQISDFEIRININSKLHKLKPGECAELSADQFESLQLETRPVLIQVKWLERCEAKKDSNICNIDQGAWLNICGNIDCTEIAHYEIQIHAGTDPLATKVENKNTNICLNLSDN